MKKIFSMALLFSVLFSFVPEKLFASNERYFVVTAYYSPLPDQKHYLKGNYKDEIRLNGRWIAWASGKWVFSGMLAAPKNYAFGTKIYLEWLGIWSVEDRWGAIVNAGQRWYSHDRIDVWMWYGDEGLKRALYWGKRTVKWSFVNNNSQTTLNYKNIPAPDWATNGLEVTPSIFYKSIGKHSSQDDIFALKKFLSENNFYSWEVNSIYSYDLISAIHDFQLQNNILQKWEISWAGYWWVKTRKLFLSHYRQWKLEEKHDPVLVAANNIQNIVTKNKTLEYNPENIFSEAVKTHQWVQELQKVLQELEMYSGEINGNYDEIIDVIVDFQIENELIENKDSLAAGYYWPQTRKALYDIYVEKKQADKKLAEDIQKAKDEVEKLKDELFQESEKTVLSLWNMKKWDVSPQVRELQILLKKLWYFNTKDTAIYGSITQGSILDFQIQSGVVNSSDDIWAWYFWPNTKAALIKELFEYRFSKSLDTNKYSQEVVEALKKSGIL